MTGDIDSILTDFAERRWDTDPFGRFYALVRDGDGAAVAAQLVTAALDRLPNGGTIVHAALSFVSREDFDRLVQRALTTESDLAESILAYASLQFPELLHPHLDTLFRLRPNAGTYYENWPWRDAGPDAVRSLAAIIKRGDAEERRKAWRCLLETRRDDALRLAASVFARIGLEYPLPAYLTHVGFAPDFTPLDSQPVMHLIFPEPQPHPSWAAFSPVAEVQFGGSIEAPCGLCGENLHRLLHLPIFVSPTASEVTIATCLSCLGWERSPLYYRHDSGDTVTSLTTAEQRITPEFPAAPLQEQHVTVSLTNPRWRWQDWAFSNDRENLNRIGGHPCWVQSAEYPDCVVCGTTMSFFVQLGSGLPTEDGEEFLWGSGGIGYVFWCRTCRVSALHWQCT